MKIYSLSCKDMGISNCDYVAMAETKEETMELATDHFVETHPKEVKEPVDKMSKDEMEQKMIDKMMEKNDGYI